MARIIAASLGDCIHVIGVRNFLHLATLEGHDVRFLGATLSPEGFVRAIAEEDPDVVGVSYRLSPDACRTMLLDLKDRLEAADLLEDRLYLFGGTAGTGAVARELGFFSEIFDGRWARDAIVAYLRRLAGDADSGAAASAAPPDTLIERIQAVAPLPLLRHHIGLETVEATVAAVARLSEEGVLDVISIAPDQTAQEAFFREEGRSGRSSGAGGVPVRTPEDLARIHDATRRGNRPLCRCYSGTAEVFQWAEMLARTIHNAWCAVPLTWYNEMDRRGPRPLGQSIVEAKQLMTWHAKRGIPVEVNEPHQWSLRRASDAVAAATAYLAAYNAKQAGVRDYVAQYMLNTPAGISPSMDLAKILAMIDLVEGLHDDEFRSYRQVRPGLSSFPVDPDAGRARLVLSTLVGMAFRPSILHVVAYCEGAHIAGPEEIVESARMARWTISEASTDSLFERLLEAPQVQRRKEQVLKEAQAILDAIAELAGDEPDPLASAAAIERAIRLGILDAPDLEGNEAAAGVARTAIIDGACVSVDPKTRMPLAEEERLARILSEASNR